MFLRALEQTFRVEAHQFVEMKLTCTAHNVHAKAGGLRLEINLPSCGQADSSCQKNFSTTEILL
jgi:hypothetical protein